jgi:hypothetical protein
VLSETRATIAPSSSRSRSLNRTLPPNASKHLSVTCSFDGLPLPPFFEGFSGFLRNISPMFHSILILKVFKVFGYGEISDAEHQLLRVDADPVGYV